MKRIFAMLLSLLLILSLAACGKETVIEPQPEPEPELEPVDLTVETYCIPLENERLYLQGSDELEYPMLTVDNYCHSYTHQGNEVVAAFADHTIRRFDLTKGTSEVLADNVEGYVAYIRYYCPDGFLFTSFGRTGETNVYRWHQGKVKLLVENTYLIYELFVSDGALIYQEYNGENDTTEIVAINIADGSERWRVTPDCEQFGMAYWQDDTVYVACNNTQLFRVEPADGSLTQIDIPFDFTRFDILAIGSNGSFLLNDYGYLSGEPGVYYADEKGVRLLDYIPVDDNYFYARKLDSVGDKVLIRSSQTHENPAFNTEEYTYTYSCYFYNVIDMAAGKSDTLFVPHGENARLFEYGDFPVMDSSTARKPVTRAIYNLFCEYGAMPGAVPVCNTTHGAWLAIADRTSDVALLAAPTKEEQSYLDEKGVKVEMKLYGGDGLVFIGNEKCGVTDLTLDDVRGIYRGKITNWSQLGGVDAPIRVLYRDDQSGSQRLFEKMIWGDGKVPNYEKLGFTRLDEMSSIVGECLYEPYTIGYSIMTYLNDVYGEEDLLAFTLDGVAAKPENVASGDYPLGTKGYVVIRADEAKDSPARRLYDWFGSTMCDEILNNNGVTPLHE